MVSPIIRAFCDDGFTALHYAANFGSAEAARVLVDAGANVAGAATNDMRVQPLHSADVAARLEARLQP